MSEAMPEGDPKQSQLLPETYILMLPLFPIFPWGGDKGCHKFVATRFFWQIPAHKIDNSGYLIKDESRCHNYLGLSQHDPCEKTPMLKGSRLLIFSPIIDKNKSHHRVVLSSFGDQMTTMHCNAMSLFVFIDHFQSAFEILPSK